MARPLTPQEATEMIMALRRQQPGAPSHRAAPTRRAKGPGGRAEADARRTPEAGPDDRNKE